MKGNISIGDFIRQVKKEIIEARDSTLDPLFKLAEVNLEISFALEADVGSKMKLYVVEVGADAKATQTHKVTLKLVPIADDAYLGGVTSGPVLLTVQPQN